MTERVALHADEDELDGPIHPLLVRSQQAFQRELGALLKSHDRQWVAYHGEERVGFGRTETELYERCLSEGLKEGEFVVRSIEPPMVDEEVVYPGEG